MLYGDRSLITVRGVLSLRWLLIFFYIPWVSANPDFQELVEADSDVGNWLTHGRTYSETRQSPLVQINPSNIDNLGLAWSFDTGLNGAWKRLPLLLMG